MRKYIFLIGMAAVLQACGIAMPIHQDHTAQTLGENGFDVGLIEAVSPMIGPKTYPAGGFNTPSTSMDVNGIPGLRIAWGFAQTWDIEAETFIAYNTGNTVYGAIKHQWYGPSYFETKKGDSYSGMRLRYGFFTGYADLDTGAFFRGYIYNGNLFVNDLSGSAGSISNAWGYAPTDWLGVYGGLEFGIMTVKATIINGYVDQNNPTFTMNRTENFWGPFGGVNFHTKGERFRLDWNIELNELYFPYSYDDGYRFTTAASGSMHFLWRIR